VADPIAHCQEVYNRAGEIEQNTRKRYTRTFQILTPTPQHGATEVRDCPLLPAMGSRWERKDGAGAVIEFDEDSRLVQKVATQNDADNLQNWTVNCEYVGLGDPTAEPPDVQWGGDKWQETTNQDVTGRLYCNSAGDPYEGGLTRDRTRRTLTITRNVLTWDPRVKDEYTDTVNETALLVAEHPPGFPAGTAKIDTIDAVAVFWEHYPIIRTPKYWRETIKISIDYRDWESSQPLDAGFRHLVLEGVPPDEVLRRVRIIDRVGSMGAGPSLLDGEGGLLPVGGAPVFAGDKAEFPPFQRYETKDWGPLNIGY